MIRVFHKNISVVNGAPQKGVSRFFFFRVFWLTHLVYTLFPHQDFVVADARTEEPVYVEGTWARTRWFSQSLSHVSIRLLTPEVPGHMHFLTSCHAVGDLPYTFSSSRRPFMMFLQLQSLEAASTAWRYSSPSRNRAWPSSLPLATLPRRISRRRRCVVAKLDLRAFFFSILLHHSAIVHSRIALHSS